jgi:broad specificity phosphatase PhoE
MKSVELRRHAEKDSNGMLTEVGMQTARKLAQTLPEFSKVVSSESDRAQLTAKLMTGSEPQIDLRAGFYMASPEKSTAINELATEQGLTFLEAVQRYNDPEVLEGIDLKAKELNELTRQLFEDLDEDGNALIVSHDLSISPAMAKRGIPLESIDPLEGYIIHENGDVRAINL